MKLLLILLLVSSQAFAQTETTTAANTSQFELPSFSLKALRERTKINYFSETQGPSIKKWDDNEVNSDGTRSNLPVRTFHSFNNQFRLFGNTNFYMSSRFVSVIGDRNEQKRNDDPHVFQMDDWQFGFSQQIYKSNNFRYDQRLTHRQPFSTYSKNSQIDSQIEWNHAFTWQPAAGWRIIHWNNYRYYQYEPTASGERYRINFSTLANYDFNDKWRTQLMYELDMQHRNPKEGPKKKDWNYFKSYENHLAWGVGYSPNSRLTFVPYIRAMDLANVRNENAVVGLWVLGKVL